VLGLTGAQASLPAWTSFMKDATAPRPALDFTIPPGIVTEKIDPLTGLKAGPPCPVAIEGVFPKGMEPTDVCKAPDGVTTADHALPEAPNPETDPND
jgi:penicillin-binding protein 2D